MNTLEFRVKDWGSAPRWVAFVDFFLASRAKHAVISGANKRVGTTYAQLIAALAAANNLGTLLVPNFILISTLLMLHVLITIPFLPQFQMKMQRQTRIFHS